MLIKDKDILVQDETSSESAETQRPLARGIDKAHMREAWGDAFDYYLRGITTKYLQFRGRATRLEFWGFSVVASILYIPLYFLGQYADMFLLPYYYAAATLIPMFAVTSRRFHDINKRSMAYLVITAALLVSYFLVPQYAVLPMIVWAGVMIRLLSKPTDEEDGLYGEPNEDDEIYGSDNDPIIAKFRLLTLMMSAIWLIATGVQSDNWKRQALQKGTIEQILDEVEVLAGKENLTTKEAAQARAKMVGFLKKLDGQAISERDKQKLIMDAVKSVQDAITTAQ